MVVSSQVSVILEDTEVDGDIPGERGESGVGAASGLGDTGLKVRCVVVKGGFGDHTRRVVKRKAYWKPAKAYLLKA